jgi:hypothetical protein
MIRFLFRLVVSALLMLLAGSAPAQNAADARPDPNQVLAEAKAASGGAAWDAMRTQHSNVRIATAGFSGVAERWSDIVSGRSSIRYSVGPLEGAAGYDGAAPWSQDASGQAHAETAETARELAVNAAYRDKLAFWFPQRAAALISYKERVSADGADFDVIRITPEGGRPFELWVNIETRLFERLVEREAQATRTEYYMDMREVQGVKVPFRVRATRGDPRADELVVVENLVYNAPLDGVSFALPAAPKPDFTFPAGRASVDVPIRIHGGHVYVPVMINGKGPLPMLLDASAANVLLPGTARKLGLVPEGSFGGTVSGERKQDIGVTRADRLDIGGVVIAKQAFTTIDIAPAVLKSDGVDDAAGMLGFEIFRRLPVRIDYRRLRATFYDPARFRYAGHGVAVPLKLRDRMPAFEGSVDGFKGVFAIDTHAGSSLALDAPFVAGNNLVASLGATQEIVAGAGVDGYVRALLARAGNFRVGTIEVERPVVTLATQGAGDGGDTDLAGSVGFGILRQFDVTIDVPGGMLYLEKNANFGQPDTFDRSGMWVERAAAGYAIVDVVKGGPAASAGVEAGSVVVAIDGKPWSALTLDTFRAALKAAPGTRVRLKLAGGKEHVVTLRDMI